MKEFYLDSCGAGRLHCALWKPEGEPKAVVQLIHGIAEHIGRYDDFARFLNSHGYVVAADDHMGHGGSVENGVKGYFSGGWLSAVEDEKRLHDEIAAQYPALPYFILGHSMGSFLLRTYLYTYPDAVDKAVISGTGISSITVEETISALAEPILNITKSISPVPVTENGALTYTFVIENRGNVPADPVDLIVITDQFNPILSDLTVTFNGTAWAEGTQYTYDQTTGLFTTKAGEITVPAATFTQNADTGAWSVIPGTSTLVITGTV